MPRVFKTRKGGRFDGLAVRSYTDIAEELGITKDQVYWAEKTALKKLEKRLGHWGEVLKYVEQPERFGHGEGRYKIAEDWNQGGLSDL